MDKDERDAVAAELERIQREVAAEVEEEQAAQKTEKAEKEKIEVRKAPEAAEADRKVKTFEDMVAPPPAAPGVEQAAAGNNDAEEHITAKQKIILKLGRLGNILANVERTIYNKYKLYYDEAEYQETKEDTEYLIENRLRVVSEYGDVINVGIDLGAHFVQAFVAHNAAKKTEETENNDVEHMNFGLG